MIRPLPPEAGNSRAVVMGTWTYRDRTLGPDLPAVRNSFNRFKNLLTSPLCGWPTACVTQVANESHPGRVPDLLMTRFAEAKDVALFYYVGHGLLSDDEDVQLCLGLSGTVAKDPHRVVPTSLPYAVIRRALLRSRARTKIVILDCCNSRSALPPTLGAVGTAVPEAVPEMLLDEASVERTYVLVAASRKYAYYENKPAADLPQTIFTKYLADLAERGLVGGQPELTMETVFRLLRANLKAGGHPVPAARGDSGGLYPFCRNAALTSATPPYGIADGSGKLATVIPAEPPGKSSQAPVPGPVVQARPDGIRGALLNRRRLLALGAVAGLAGAGVASEELAKLGSSPAHADSGRTGTTRSPAMTRATASSPASASPSPSPTPSTPSSPGATCYFGCNDGTLFAVDAATGDVLWNHPTGGSPAPTITQGAVYAGGGGSVYALDTQGRVRWRTPTGGNPTSPPVVIQGLVYANVGGGSIYAMDTGTGLVSWNHTGGGTSAASQSPAVAQGLLYAGGDDGTVYAMDMAAGTIRWRFPAGGAISTPVLAGSGIVCFVMNRWVYALDMVQGRLLWKQSPGFGGDLAPTIGDGVVYIGGDFGGSLFAVHATTGRALWTAPNLSALSLAPTAASGGVYTDGWSNVIALDAADGTVRWNRHGLGNTFPPVVASGVVYAAGSANKTLCAIDAHSGAQNWAFTTYGSISSPPTVAGGAVYVACDDNVVYAIDAATGKRRWIFPASGAIKSSAVIWPV